MRNREKLPYGQSMSSQPGGPSGSEKGRLAILFFGALVVTGMAVFLDSSGGEARDPLVDDGAQQQAEPRDIELVVSPWNPPVEQVNDLIDESTPLARSKIVYEAMNAMARAVRGRSHINFLADKSESGGYARVSAETLADPARAEAHRGKGVVLLGPATTIELVDARRDYGLAEDQFPDAELMWSGIIESEGQPVRFLVVGTGSQSMTVTLGDRAKVFGVFHRVIDEVPLEGSEGEVQTMPFILATRVVEAIPEVKPNPLTPEMLAEIESAEQEIRKSHRSPHRENIFYKVLGYALDHGAEWAAKAEELRELKGLAPVLKPGDYRLQPVRVSGAIAYMAHESFEYTDMSEGDAPCLGYWHAIVARWETDKHAPISVAIPDHLVPDNLRAWAELSSAERRKLDAPWLDGVGIYYRLHRIEMRNPDRPSEGSGRTSKYPMVIMAAAPSMRIAPRGTTRDDTNFMLGFGGVGLLIAGSLGFLLWRDRKKSERHEAHMRAERIKRRKNQDFTPPKA